MNSTPFDPELGMLVERARVVQRVPDVIRARALARARATVASAAMGEPVHSAQLPVRGMRIAVAASVAMAVGAAAATAALHHRTAPRTDPKPPAIERVVPASHTPAFGVRAPEAAVIAEAPLASPHRPTRSSAARESYAAELELLQRAQAAYANQDYQETLALVSKHGRQFPNGRLAEEREALRVRSLAASGRTDEERRAVAAFTRRFPRSVLLSRFRSPAADSTD